jgi:DNA-binding HxlR family transcriptional regulator
MAVQLTVNRIVSYPVPVNWLDFDTELCAVQRTLGVVGEKWTMLLIRDCANGVHRFDDFRRHVGLSEAVLADRLRTLVANGIFETREYQEPGQRRRREYRLTEKGWDLFPVLVALMQFGLKHLSADGADAWQVQHKACGHPVVAEVRCSFDSEVLTPRDTQAVWNPGAGQLSA